MANHKKSVLIVDDNEGICRTLGFIFEKDYDTAVAHTGQEALEHIRRQFFHLVLLDIRLPDIEGTELLHRIREAHPDTATIILTGHASLENAVEALNAGAFAYVIKPFNVPELLAMVRQAIEKQCLAMENRRLLADAHRELEIRSNIENELQRYREHLEDLVKERTVELNTVIGQLRMEINRRRNLEEKLVEANEELKSFCASISHDLQSPLNAVKGFAESLRRDYGDRLDEKGVRFLNHISDSAGRMCELVGDLLQYSMMGRKELHRSELDVGQLVAEVIEEVRYAEPNHEVQAEIQPLPSVCADRGMLREVFSNLISNAVKYARRGEAAVLEIGGQRRDQESFFYVKDNGIGFDMQEAPRVFKMFERLHPDDSVEGTGAGLAIVDRILQRHRGRIWVQSEPGQGTTFHFVIPDPPEEGLASP
jgi:two-component system, sensor histidine kinase and response regulator